jgi:TusA-related sulfurtransferase
MYKLLKDKNNEFQCEIKLEGTSASGAKVRLFLEADGCEYSFNGEIKGERCVVPMGKLKKFGNLLESGKIRLEVVADDTLFVPYENTYQVDESKKVTVEVIQQDTQAKKPIVEVKVEEPVPVVKIEEPKPVTKVQRVDPLKQIKKYLNEQTYFDGSLESLKVVLEQPKHKKVFNTICENNKLDKRVVLMQILT